MSPARALDQFYTARPVAKTCFDFLEKTVQLTDKFFFLEPSAGDGAFFELMPPRQRLGVDLQPKHPEIQKADFLTEFQPNPRIKNWVVLGNPPFGKNASLAVRFFNKAAEFADVIAFVVPLTFKKNSLLKKLSRDFVLVDEITLERESFVFEGRPYAVPCCFQVWQRTKEPRVDTDSPLTHPDFEFCKSGVDADFAFRRVGGLAGKVISEFQEYSPASHYFIRSNIEPAVLLKRFQGLNWDDVKWHTAGNPSISKRELVAKYAKAVNPDLTANLS